MRVRVQRSATFSRTGIRNSGNAKISRSSLSVRHCSDDLRSPWIRGNNKPTNTTNTSNTSTTFSKTFSNDKLNTEDDLFRTLPQLPRFSNKNPSKVTSRNMNRPSPSEAARLAEESLTQLKKHIEQSAKPNTRAFTTAITALRTAKQYSSIVQLWTLIKKHKITPERVALKWIIEACAEADDHDVAMDIITDLHSGRIPTPIDAVSCSHLIKASKQISSVALLTVYSSRDTKGAMMVLSYLDKLRIRPEEFVYRSLLKACTTAGDLESGKKVHEHLKQRIQSNLEIDTALLNMYTKLGDTDSLSQLISNTKNLDTIAWNTVIKTTLQMKGSSAFHGLIQTMKNSGVAVDIYTWNILIEQLGTDGEISTMMKLFTSMNQIGFQPDVVTLTSVIKALALHRSVKEAMKVYELMKSGNLKPTAVTYTILFTACGKQRDLENGKKLHKDVLESGVELDVSLMNSIVTMYIQCKKVEIAQKVFDQMKSKDVVTWTRMIAGYGQAKQPHKAVELLDKMVKEGCVPNELTMSSVLFAFAASSMVEKCEAFLNSMESRFGIVPNEYHKQWLKKARRGRMT